MSLLSGLRASTKGSIVTEGCSSGLSWRSRDEGDGREESRGCWSIPRCEADAGFISKTRYKWDSSKTFKWLLSQIGLLKGSQMISGGLEIFSRACCGAPSMVRSAWIQTEISLHPLHGLPWSFVTFIIPRGWTLSESGSPLNLHLLPNFPQTDIQKLWCDAGRRSWEWR